MRIFFDSSVLVAAFSFPGLCSKLLAMAVARHDVIVSEYVIDEVSRTLRNKFRASDSEIEDHERWLRKHATVIANEPMIDLTIRDPNDLPIVSASVAATADVLVSGDKDLLELENSPIRILSPRALHDLIIPR